MRLLVTGGAGFVGAHAIRVFLDRGFDVLNVDALTPAASLSAVWDLQESPSYSFLPLDISDAAGLAGVVLEYSPSVILHLAAETDAARTQRDPLETVRTNVLGTVAVLEAARALRATGEAPEAFRVVFVQSDAGTKAVGPERAAEKTPPPTGAAPLSATRSAVERLVDAWGQSYGVPIVAVRVGEVYGPWQARGDLIARTLQRALAGGDISLDGFGSEARDWLHVEDLATALALVVEHGSPGAAYDVASGIRLRAVDVARAVCRLLQVKRPVALPYTALISEAQKDIGVGPQEARVTSPMLRHLGWRPKTRFEEGLAKTVDWHLSNPSWVAGKRDAEDLPRQGSAA